ncbi:hypothetical protein AVL55_13145 [Alteromonas macleodii]|uniref:Uncharacterized protein n=1 Tax=Alteromonas macleodii TaxID=28108 RepID=A0A126Q1E3_ALTMA|nr:hypothetical protein AVL55_13145 [Alteromonas macleodii]
MIFWKTRRTKSAIEQFVQLRFDELQVNVHLSPTDFLIQTVDLHAPYKCSITRELKLETK